MTTKSQDKGQQADPAKLAEAMRSTSSIGKTPEQWADQVWSNTTTK